MALSTLRDFFFWNMVLNMSLLLFSFVMILFLRKWAHKVHGSLFKMSDAQLDAVWYSILVGYKILVFAFNIVPYVALRIMT